jgi:hypothetical protein
MAITASPDVKCTQREIEITCPESVSDDALRAMVRVGKQNRSLETMGWERTRVDDRTFAWRPTETARLRPAAGERLQLTIVRQVGDEEQRDEREVEVSAATSTAPSEGKGLDGGEPKRSTAGAAGYGEGPTSGGGYGKAPSPKRAPSYEPSDAGKPCCDEVANLLKVPLRVQAGAGIGGAVGEDLEAWSEGIVETVFPRLPHRADPFQFRESLAELTGAFAQPSPYGGGAVAFAPTPGARPWCGGSPAGGWSGGGWSVNGGSGSWAYAGVPGGYSGGGRGGGAGGSPVSQVGAAVFPTAGAGAPGSWPTGIYAGGAGGVGAPLGMADLTGPFAALASIAGALEMNAVPAARDIGPLTQDADLDRIEAERSVVLDILTSLIAELRQPAPDGPERSVALSLTTRLLQHVGELGFAAEILANPNLPPTKTNNAVTPADFANVSRFDVLFGWATTAKEAVDAFDPAAVDARATVAIVKQLLAVIVEKTRELELELDAADFGPAERGRFEVANATGDEITVARLLEWLQEQAGRHLPRLLDSSGTLAKDSVVTTLTEQQAFVAALAARTDFPWTYPIVDRLIDELSLYLGEAITTAGTL